jgi:hypothetical protein
VFAEARAERFYMLIMSKGNLSFLHVSFKGYWYSCMNCDAKEVVVKCAQRYEWLFTIYFGSPFNNGKITNPYKIGTWRM